MRSLNYVKQFGPWAIVTGASSGIGEEFAHQLASQGINLFLVARRSALLETLGGTLKSKYGIQFRTLTVDLSEHDAYKKVILSAKDLPVGLLVSNAGTGRPGRFLDRDTEDLTSTLNLNCLSHAWLAHYYGRQFANRGNGGIIFTGAMGATNGVPFMAMEAGTKAFIEGLSKSLHVELKDKGVHVTVLITPPTQTPVLKELGITQENIPTTPISSRQCVSETLAALVENKPTVLPGMKFKLMDLLVPKNFSRQVMGRMMKRNNKIE